MRRPGKLRLPFSGLAPIVLTFDLSGASNQADKGHRDESLSEYTVFPLEGNVASSVKIVECMGSKV